MVGRTGCGTGHVAEASPGVRGGRGARGRRGEKMEDGICSGSDARKRTASAEVRLRFAGGLKTLGEHNGNGRHDEGNGNGHEALANG